MPITEVERLREYIKNNDPTETINRLRIENNRLRSALEYIAHADFSYSGTKGHVHWEAKKALARI